MEGKEREKRKIKREINRKREGERWKE